MRIDLGQNRAVCLREEDSVEISLLSNGIKYKGPNGQVVTVLYELGSKDEVVPDRKKKSQRNFT